MSIRACTHAISYVSVGTTPPGAPRQVHPARWLLDDPCISLRANATSGASAAAVARACGMWEFSEVRRIVSRSCGNTQRCPRKSGPSQ